MLKKVSIKKFVLLRDRNIHILKAPPRYMGDLNLHNYRGVVLTTEQTEALPSGDVHLVCPAWTDSTVLYQVRPCTDQRHHDHARAHGRDGCPGDALTYVWGVCDVCNENSWVSYNVLTDATRCEAHGVGPVA